ncbi:Ptgr1_1 protein [Gryllus bimaculatus]|nr:Ptgr1_1 protein [Gryllus bimaculatus]
MVKAQKWILAKHFSGEPKEDDLKLEEEELPELKDGEILVEAVFWSVDPYMRPYTARFPVGITMIGSQVGKIVESKAKDFPEGRYIVGYFGWRTHTVHDTAKEPLPGFPKAHLLPDFKELPYSLALGVLGMPGNTAYFGFLEICEPKEGETVVVTGAAGAVGSIVGQIAKIKGCRVIGFAGSDEKVKWLTEELGFDAAYNYKTKDVNEALKEGAPKGVDCYFDNVGGDISSTVLNHMNTRGRISVCGSISSYNADPANYPRAAIVQPSMVFKELRMEGFIVHRWTDRWMEGIHTNLKWIREGKLKYRETVTEGFKNMPKAFMGMLKGENTGKAIIKA